MSIFANHGFEVIDFHLHPFGTREDSVQWYRPYHETMPDEFADELKRIGINRFAGSVITARSRSVKKEDRDERFYIDATVAANRETLRLREKFGDAYIPGMQINPNCVQKSLEEIEFMSRNGVRLIGELVPYFHGWGDYDSPEMDEILDFAAEKNMVVSFHTADNYANMVKKHKNVRFVKAHAGDGQALKLALDLAEEADNFHLDISAVGYDRYGMMAYIVSKIEADRLLFGTDFPINNPAATLAAVLYERISDGDREKILSGNAKRLLGIE